MLKYRVLCAISGTLYTFIEYLWNLYGGHDSGSSEKMNSWSHKAFFQMNAMKADEHDSFRYDKFVEMLRPLDFRLGRREVEQEAI